MQGGDADSTRSHLLLGVQLWVEPELVGRPEKALTRLVVVER